MRGLKIAHLCRWLEVGGTERVILDLCRLGSGKQWVVAAQDGPMRPVFERCGIEVRVGTSPKLLTQHLDDADVVNVHWLEFQPPIFEAAQAAARPVVFTLHGLTVLPPLPGQVLCTSRRVYDLREPNRDRRVLILNGVDTLLFRPRARRRGGPVRIIRACRPVRCAEYFWPALSHVLEVCPEAELKVVGGPAYAVGRIEALGDRHDVAQQMALSDVFAYAPWPHEGTRDLVVLEAMASGLACIVSDVPCIRESVEHGVTGLLTPFGDVRAFAESLVRVVKDGALREALGRRAAEVAQEQFDMRQRCVLYEAAYARALPEVASVRPVGALQPCVACS